MVNRSNRFAFFLGSLSQIIASIFCSLQSAFAEDFDWRNVNGGQYFVSPVKNQFFGTCWAHGNIGCLEAKYMLTRNDPNFSLDLSEENLVIETTPHDLGATIGGGPYEYSFQYFSSHGVVLESELPGFAPDYQQSGIIYGDQYNGVDPNNVNLWPLSSGWDNRVVKTVPNSYKNDFAQQGTQAVKNALKMYGPLSANMGVDNDWWPNPNAQGGAHTILIVGFHDDASAPGGGYWIVKNSWGLYDSQYGAGFSAIPYAKRPYQYSDANAITGAAYYTGSLATAAWNGGDGVWTLGDSTKWSGYAWENKETAATFGGTGGTISLNGTVIAHGMTINSGAAYTFTGGALTVTAGGITANDNTTINSPLSIGGPQTWTVVGGKTLTVGGAMHTIISDTTVAGTGNVIIAGSIDGGGVLNTFGAKPGGIIKNNTGSLTLTGASNYSGDITVNTGTLNITPAGGTATTFSGAFFGNNGMIINSTGITSIGGGASNYYGSITLQGGGTLQFVPISGVTGSFYGLISGASPIVQNGPGTTSLSNSNTYTGSTTISSGSLQAVDTVGLPSLSFLSLDGGVLQTGNSGSTTFTRPLGASGHTFQWTANGGGFSSSNSSMTVNIGGHTTPDTLIWGAAPADIGSKIVGPLKLSSTSAANLTNFRNSIDLAGATRTVQVDDNPNSTNDYAQISGAISGSGTSSLMKTGDGKLLLSVVNSYTGDTIISGGALQAAIGTGIPSNRFISLDGGVYQSNSSYTFNRNLGVSGNAFQWTSNGGGFSAGNGALTVNVNGGATLIWGSTVGSQLVGTLKLSSKSAVDVTTFQNNINLNGDARTINVDDNSASGSDYAVLSGAISDSAGGGSMTKTGLGKLVINGSFPNTYTGTTTIFGGDLDLNKSTGPAIPGNLVLGGVTNYKVRLLGADQISATSSLTWNSSDNVGLQELELYGHDLIVTGITDLIAHGVIENTSSEYIGSGTNTLTVNSTANCTYSGILRDNNGGSGKIAVVKAGSGTLTLSGGGYDDNIRYTGGTTVSGGTLVFRDILYSPIQYYNVALANNAALVIDSSANFSGVISGTGSLTKNGNGTLKLNSPGNTYVGATAINGGTVKLAASSGYAITGNFTISNANTYVICQNANQFPATARVAFAGTGDPHFEIYGNIVTVASISGTGGGAIENTEGETGVVSGTLIVDNPTSCSYNGIIRDTAWGSGKLALVKNGSGTLTLTGGSSGGYTGGLTVNNGTLNCSLALPNCDYTITGGTLNINVVNQSIGSFRITGGTVSGTGIKGVYGTLTSNSAYDIQAGSVIARLAGTNIALNKTGGGLAILSGTNSYTGTTTISSGILQANNYAGLPNASFLKLDGGILQNYGTSAVTFSRNLSSVSGVNAFKWTANGGGFAAGAAALTVKINNNTNPVSWGDTEGANIAGILKLSSTTAANVVDFQNGINLDGTIRTIQVDDNPNSTTDSAKISGIIANGSGMGGITKTSAGLLTLSAANTYTGATAINAGNLALDVFNALNPASAVSIAGSSNLILNVGSSYTFANTISGTGGIFVKNPTTSGVSVNLSSNLASFTGKITSDAKVQLCGLQNVANLGNIDVQVNNGGQIYDSGSTAYGAKSLSIAGQGYTNATDGPTGALRIGGDAIYTGPITLTADAAISSAANGTVSGNITGAYQLQILPVWTGDTQITLSGSNNYNSTLVGKHGSVPAVLVAGSESAFGPAGVSGPLVLDGGTLKLNGYGFSFANLTSTTQGGQIENGAATATVVTLGADGTNTIFSGSLDDGGPAALSLIKTGGGMLTLTGSLIYTGNTAINAGTLQINTPTATLTTITGTGTLSVGPGSSLRASSIRVGTLNIGITSSAAVPEPCTLVLLIGAALAAMVLRKRIFTAILPPAK